MKNQGPADLQIQDHQPVVLQFLFKGLKIGLCIDQTHQGHNTMQTALSRAVPLFPRKMRYQGQPLETNRSHSLLEEMKRNALQQTELCTSSTSRKHQALLPCFTPWKAEHGYLPLGKNSVALSAGRKILTLTQKQNIKSFSFSFP